MTRVLVTAHMEKMWLLRMATGWVPCHAFWLAGFWKCGVMLLLCISPVEKISPKSPGKCCENMSQTSKSNGRNTKLTVIHVFTKSLKAKWGILCMKYHTSPNWNVPLEPKGNSTKTSCLWVGSDISLCWLLHKNLSLMAYDIIPTKLGSISSATQ